MANEGLLGLSPAHRRNTPQSPSLFRRTLSHPNPDHGWRNLAHRHKFLLYMLGILTVLCTIYLYFAISLGTRDSCSGLGGTQRALCQLGNKAGQAKAHKTLLRRLMSVEDSDPVDDAGVKQSMKEFLALMSTLASRKERVGEGSGNNVHLKVEQWNGDIGTYKAILDSMNQTNAKSDTKFPRASHLRGNNFHRSQSIVI